MVLYITSTVLCMEFSYQKKETCLLLKNSLDLLYSNMENIQSILMWIIVRFLFIHISEKNKRRAEHHKAIFSALREWNSRKFKIAPDFNIFRSDLMKIDIIEQILSRSEDDKKNPIKFNEMVLDHLNCKDYQNSYQKYRKINELQDSFISQITHFLEYYKNHLRKFLNSHNIHSTGKQLEDYLQIYIYWIDYKQDLSDKDFESLIADTHGQIIITEEPYQSLTNPFLKLTELLIIDIKNQSNEVVGKVHQFKQMIDQIKNEVEEFQKSLDSIIAYESLGLKGKCGIEERLRFFKKFW
jgi:hypothetical protein